MQNVRAIKFQNGYDLLENCIGRLRESQSGGTGGNVALCPIIIIFMGEKSREYVRHIKDTLDDNWNNSHFLKYLNVYKAKDTWECISLSETKEYDRWKDKGSSEKFGDLLNKSIVMMLEAEEKIFADRTRVKLEFVLDATEKDNIEYYELFRGVRSKLYTNDLKTLYLMIDQKPEENRAKKSNEIIQYIVNDRSKKGSTIYLISNYLQSGKMLGENKIWENYRLVANIILLGGNRGGTDNYYTNNLYNGLKTASYALITKPTDEIAAISLQALLSEMYSAEKKDNFHDLSEKDIREKLGMDNYNGMNFAENIFQEEIAKDFPSKEALQYLPFETQRSYGKTMRKEGITTEDLDIVTMGAASAYINYHYKEKVNKFFKEEADKIREKVSLQLRNIFRYFELLKLDKMRMELQGIIMTEYYYSGSGQDDFIGQVHKIAVYESKKIFYEKMKKIVKDEIERLINASLQFQNLYSHCEDEVRKARVITGDESESVEKAYGNIVKEFVKYRYNSRVGFREVFCADADKPGLLQAVWKVFLDLIKNEVYGYDFEREVDARLDRMNDEQRHIFVAKELKKKLDGSIRLKNPIQVPMLKTSCFYMVNEKAEYAENLRKAEGNNKNYLLFNLNRTDCIEQLEIYNIIAPCLIQLMLTEE